MRQKIYYSKSEITEHLYTPGQQWMTEDFTEYIGLYHRYITGEVYTEEKWKPNQSKKLIEFVPQITNNIIYRTNKPNLKTKYITPTPYFINITTQDIQRKFVTRYFLQRTNQPVVIEIDQPQFNLWGQTKIDQSLYTGVSVNWKIIGESNTITRNSVTIIGVIEYNLDQINQAKKILPAIETKLNNPLELYVDTTIIVPPPIN
jgi:hypothetical protein